MADQITNQLTTLAGWIELGGQAIGARQLRFAGYNNPYVVQLYKYVDDGMKVVLAPEEYVYPANAGDVFGPDVAGARFRSYSVNPVGMGAASIYAVLAYEPDPIAAPIPPFALIPSTSPSPGSSYRIAGVGHKAGMAGVPTQLDAAACSGVSVRANPANAGLVYLGAGGVSGADGYILSPGDAVAFLIGNTNLVYFDVAATGDGVSWLAIG